MPPPEQDIPAIFVQHAADILADTNTGLSGPVIVRATGAYALEYDVAIPHPTYPFEASNKRTALFENVVAFTPKQRYRILRELCDHSSFSLVPNKERQALKLRLITRYGHLDPKDIPSEVNETLVEETRHWLSGFPEALSLVGLAKSRNPLSCNDFRVNADGHFPRDQIQ